ncbi:Dedicator of cytokinesis protein 1 [Fulvia fulva]|nr:Dedicator of cytokinesis protein 1 [Fulvia fulva]WPV08814.1 Dedicator of cytokinesis protein 1 [Fulvia fulva]WPV23768.1 Dedicator of cytokinesis protein 1 [Fulvia fulva]
MPWKPLVPSVAFAICTYPFRATEANDLPLQIGDHIYIIEQGGRSNEWYRGYLVAPPSILAGLTSDRGQQLEHRVFSGIFPRNCVEVREYLGEGQDESTDDGTDGGQTVGEDDSSSRRKSYAYKKRLSRRQSTRSTRSRKRKSVLVAAEPLPRDPNAPRPLAPVPLLRVGDETGLSAAEPLVDEIASCLREWHDARLHELLLARGYTHLAKVQDLIKRVDSARNQLMHDVLTARELAELREDTVWDLVAGNKLLNDEVIVRSPTEKGRMLTAEDSVIEMTKLQANMSILDRPPKPTLERNMLHHILVDVRTLICDSDQPATLQMCLCIKEYNEKPRPLSENYAISVPVPVAATQEVEDQTKSLFVNLTNLDVGIGAEMNSLYVVFRLLRDEPVRQMVHGQGMNHQQRPTLLSNVTGGSEKLNTAKGRRSVFGSQRKRETHGRMPSPTTDSRPNTSQSQRSESTGRSSNATVEQAPVASEVKTVRRTIGVGTLDITKLAQSKSYSEQSVTLWTPSSVKEDTSDEGDDWTELVRELQHSSARGFSRVRLIKRLDVFVKAFATADLEGLVRNSPQLLHDVLMTPKLGFSGVPNEKRSDIYLTLTEPMMTRSCTLAHSKYGAVPLSQRCQTSLANLQLTLEVRKANGERIDDCIFTAANHQGHTAWRTTGVERGEGWNQTIRLAIPAAQVPGSHVVMSIADSPNFPFALAWLPLWEYEAFVRDGDHHVALYVYDEYSSSIIGGKGAYLALPPWHDKTDTNQNNAALISLRTFLCSTEYSQDPTLLGVLHWRNYHGEQLIELLERFPFVSEVEIVKLLRDVFGALFEILHEYETLEEYEDVVFYNFVVILSIARDKRFELGGIIEEYATTRHDWPHAGHCLVKAFQRLVSNPMDPESSRKLRTTFKVGDQILKLIVETTRHFGTSGNEGEQLNGTPGPDRQAAMRHELNDLFVAIMALLRNPMPVLLGTQTLLIQHFHAWLSELASVMAPAEILEIATDLLDSCSHAKGRMILYRLILIANYSHLEVFKTPETRTTLVANTFRWLDPYWGRVAKVTDQWRDQVRLCCSVVAAQMEELGEETCQYVPKLTESFTALQTMPRASKRVFSMLFPTSYPFPTKTVAQVIDVDEAMLEISALLAAALTSERRLYFDATRVDVTNILLQALQVGQSVLSCEAFPRSWLSLHVSHHRYGMTALERISDTMIESLPDIYAPNATQALEFDTESWRAFFDTLFAALGSPTLAMETFPEQKRRAVWKIAGDVRELGANLLRRCWEAIGWETDEETRRLHGFQRMGGYQVQFVPELVAPVVELCLSVHASLRSVAIEVLRSMIVGAWQIDQDLSIVQTAMIDCLDKLCRTKDITESMLQKTFVPEMLEQFEPLQRTVEDSLYIAVVDMFGKIEDLLGMLAGVHQRGSAINDATRLVDTLRLMEFLKDVQSEEGYVRYVHQLKDMQLAAGNITEAGLALQMHASRYEWDPSVQLPETTDPKLPAQTAFERKELLYFQTCQYFEKGKAWKRALAVYRELAVQYELNIFDFSKLARAQRAIASIQERIARGDRATSRYFRVVYRGLGFPPSLRDKHFIFEGIATDRIASFEDRMQQLHPAARILRGDLEPEVEGQYLQIFAVSPNKDIEHMVYQRTKVSQTVREYNLISNPHRFATTTRQPAQDIPITEQVVEKVVYTTVDEFPTILRRSEIVNVETVTLLPIEAAIERTTRKTQELLAMEKRIASGDDDGTMARLTEDLLNSVDPSSDSSVARYRGLLPPSEIADSLSSDIDPSIYGRDQGLDSMQNALKVALLDHALAIRRCLSLFKSSAHLPARAELVPRFEASFEHEISILFPQKTNMVDEITPRSSIEIELEQRPSEQMDTVEGAAVQDDPEPQKRRRRRSSLPFIGGRAASRQGRTNGVEESGRQSRRGSRGRDRSHSRLSFFRKGSDAGHHQDGEGGRGSSGGGGMGLRKRLSFLNP